MTSLDSIGQYTGRIRSFLAEESVMDVCVNPMAACGSTLWAAAFETKGLMSPAHAILLLSVKLREQSCELNSLHPILENAFPLSGDRLEGMIRPRRGRRRIRNKGVGLEQPPRLGKLTASLRSRVMPEEKQLLTEQAQQSVATLSQWARKVLLEAAGGWKNRDQGSEEAEMKS